MLTTEQIKEFSENADIKSYFSDTFNIDSEDELTNALQDSNQYYFVVQSAQSGGESLLLHRMRGNFFLEVDGEKKEFLSSEHYYQYMKVVTAIKKTTQNERLTSLNKLKANMGLQPLLAAATNQNESPNNIAVNLNRQPLPLQGTCVNNLLEEKWYQDESTKILHQGLLAQFRDPRNIEQREILFERTANKHIIVFLPNKEGNPTLARLAINSHKGQPGKHLLGNSLETIKLDEEVLNRYTQDNSAATTQNCSRHPDAIFTLNSKRSDTKYCLII